jgi:hypothetical protein
MDGTKLETDVIRVENVRDIGYDPSLLIDPSLN